jgi:hypothetical protein
MYHRHKLDLISQYTMLHLKSVVCMDGRRLLSRSFTLGRLTLNTSTNYLQQFSKFGYMTVNAAVV